MGRVLIWFSCGAASAIAAKVALEKYQDRECEICYTDPGAEHEDNRRFMSDIEKALGVKVRLMKSEKYNDIYEVFTRVKYIVGVAGAPCTKEMKRKVREQYQRGDDHHVFGYTKGEEMRSWRFGCQNPGVSYESPLIGGGYSKQDCFSELKRMGVKLPAMYLMGYKNNNCIGCVKGQSGYWNKIRRDFPDTFQKTAKLERELNAAINKRYEKGKRIRVFLDELDSSAGRYEAEPAIPCGAVCEIDFGGDHDTR